MHNFLANYVRKKLITNSLWDKFILELKKQKEDGSINDEEIEMIISFRETEKILKEKGEGGFGEIINSEKILKKKEENLAKEKKMSESENIITEQKKMIDNLSQELKKEKDETKAKDNKINKNLEIIENKAKELERIYQSLETKCTEKWKRIIDYATYPIGALVYILLWKLYFKIKFLFSNENIKITILLIVFLIIFYLILEFRTGKKMMPKKFVDWLPDKLDFLRLRKYLENRAIKKCITKKKKDLFMITATLHSSQGEESEKIIKK